MLAILGAAILAIALFALRQPQGNSAAAGSATGSPTKQAATTSHATPTRASSTAPSTSKPATPTSEAATGKLALLVLNNTTIQGLAQQASATFRAGGWTVTRYDNYTNDIVSTCAYYDPSIAGAQAAATALRAQFPAIKRVEPKFPELPAGPIVVVLTPDYVPG